MDITDVEFTRFIDFLIEKTKDSVEPLTMASIVFKEFSQLEGDQIPTGYGPYSRFHFKIAPVIDKFHNYSIETRIRLMFALGAKVSPEFLALTREHGIAQLDGRNRICKYESEDGTLQLGTAHSESAKRCSASDSDQGGAKIAKITEEPQITQHPTKSEENYESQIAQLQKLWNNDEYVGSRHEIPSKGPEFKFEHKRDNDLENPDLFFRKPKSEIDLDEIWHDDDEIEHSISSFRGNTINFHDFLKKFRKFLCYLEIPELDGLKSRINISIETTSDEILEFADLHKTFETFFFGINRKIRSTAAANSMPLNVFLIKFKCFLLGLGSPQILDFQHMVQAEIDDPTVVNKILHLNDICQAVSFLFSIIAH